MPSAFTAKLGPTTASLMGAVLVGRRRPRNTYAKRDQLRISQRLAHGLTPAQVARAEGTEESAVTALLARDGFKALVASHAAQLAEPAEQHTARLVRLARQTLENALTLDWDVGAALFVLEEHARQRDPALTLANGVIAASRRAARSSTAGPPPTPPPDTPAATAPPRPYDPLTGLMQRGAARLRRAVLEEQGAHLAVTAGPAGAAAPVTTLVELGAQGTGSEVVRQLRGVAHDRHRPHPPPRLRHGLDRPAPRVSPSPPPGSRAAPSPTPTVSGAPAPPRRYPPTPSHPPGSAVRRIWSAAA